MFLATGENKSMGMKFWFPQVWETLPKRSISHPVQIAEVYCVAEGGSVWAVSGRAVGGHQRDVHPTNRTGIGYIGKLAVEPLGMLSSSQGHPLTLCALPTHNPILWMVFHMCFQ